MTFSIPAANQTPLGIFDAETASHPPPTAVTPLVAPSDKVKFLVYGIHKDKWGLGRKKYLDWKWAVLPCATIDEFTVLADEKKRQHCFSNRPKIEEQFLDRLRKHNKYRDAPGASRDNNSAVRHKAKGGLLWAAENKIPVRIVLDGIDMEAVVNKSFKGKNSDHPAGDDSIKNRAITGSELRSLYRDTIDHPERGEHRTYWFNFRQVPPPWEKHFTVSEIGEEIESDGAPLWEPYKQKCRPE